MIGDNSWLVSDELHVDAGVKYCIAGNFHKVQIFAIFVTHDQNAKIRTAKYETVKI